jgi:hypothetical protein
MYLLSIPAQHAECPWEEQFGFCPYETASKAWQWMHNLFS